MGVFAELSRGILAGLVGGQLYLPTAWSTDAARCTQVRVPAATQAYRTKPARAAALVKRLLGSGLAQANWVGAMRPTATRPPCARPWKAAGRPMRST